MGIEPTTSSLPRKRSTPELRRRYNTKRNAQRNRPRGKSEHSSSAQTKIYKTFRLCKLQSYTLKSTERETRLEPATYSLEGCRSTNWATPAFILLTFLSFGLSKKTGGESRIRTYVAEAADLQSAPFDRSGISPLKNWAAYWTRTNDRLITNQLLYQLS